LLIEHNFKGKYEEDFNTAEVKVIEGVNHVAGVVSYVYGGAWGHYA